MNLLDKIETFIINPLIGLVAALAFLVFFWGVFEFLAMEEKRDDGKRHMLWGAIGLFIVLSAGAILVILYNTIQTI